MSHAQLLHLDVVEERTTHGTYVRATAKEQVPSNLGLLKQATTVMCNRQTKKKKKKVQFTMENDWPVAWLAPRPPSAKNKKTRGEKKQTRPDQPQQITANLIKFLCFSGRDKNEWYRFTITNKDDAIFIFHFAIVSNRATTENVFFPFFLRRFLLYRRLGSHWKKTQLWKQFSLVVSIDVCGHV